MNNPDNIVYNVDAETRSLYIHWPFCPYRCHFCPFVALAGQDQYMEQYHKALISEIERFAALCPQKLELDTIFFGGGTPSTYPDELLLDISGILKKSFIFTPDIEITIEVNPGTVRPGQLALWKQVGINRLSIGVQSLNDTVLKNLNRHQSAADVCSLLDTAQHLFENMSIDLILGLPSITFQEWQNTVKQVVLWPIKHVSIYFLTIHEHTQLYYRVKRKTTVLPCDDQVVDWYWWTRDFLKENGFEQYELSNFARPGFISRHNSVYWDRKPYKGFGLGACSFDGLCRLENEKNLTRYMQLAYEGNEVVVGAERLTDAQVHLERLMLGLRRSKGVSWLEIEQFFPVESHNRLRENLATLKERGLVWQEGEIIRLTPAGLAVENEVVIKLS